jgi:basic membrane protein A and related proteins
MKAIKLIFLVVFVSLVLFTGCDLIANLFGGGESNQVSIPIFTPQPGFYPSARNVAIACETQGASIYYTIDGFPPTVASTLYTDAIQIDENTSIKAIAIKSGMKDSDVAVGHFFIGIEEGTIVGMLFTEGGLGDQGYNDGSYDGLLAAQDQFDIAITSAESNGNHTAGLEDLADEGAELVFGISWAMTEELKAAASARSGAFFAGIDIWLDPSDSPNNAIGVLFREQESGFLAGIVAGFLTYEHASISEKLNDQNVVGIVKGMEIDPVERFATGFYAGVKLVNPGCEVLSRTSGSFSDQVQGAADAQEMIDLGADIIFNIAGETGIGAMQAAEDAGVLAIGVDVDQNHLFPNTVITSAIKDLENVVSYITGQHLAGNLSGGSNIVLGLDEESTGIAPFHSFDSIIPAEVTDALSQAITAIKAGDLVVPEFMDDMLNIGVAGPHSGDVAIYGLPTLNAMNILIMQINQNGGVLDKYVNIIEADAGCNPDLAAETAQSLIDAGVVGVIGHICSLSTEPALEVYGPAGIPVISPSSTRPSLTRLGANPTFFRTIPPDDFQALALVNFAADTLGSTSAAVVHDTADEYGTANAEYTISFIEKTTGITGDFERGINFSADYTSDVTALGASGVDVVIFHGGSTNSAAFLNSLRTVLINIPYLIWDNAAGSDFIDAVGANTSGIYAGGQMSSLALPEAADFIADYNDMFGVNPGAFAVNGYAAGAALIAAIVDSGSTASAEIISSLHSGEFDTSLGPIGFDSNGDVTNAASGYRIYSIQDGVFAEYSEL